jgi:hypothetical protein
MGRKLNISLGLELLIPKALICLPLYHYFMPVAEMIIRPISADCPLLFGRNLGPISRIG